MEFAKVFRKLVVGLDLFYNELGKVNHDDTTWRRESVFKGILVAGWKSGT